MDLQGRAGIATEIPQQQVFFIIPGVVAAAVGRVGRYERSNHRPNPKVDSLGGGAVESSLTNDTRAYSSNLFSFLAQKKRLQRAPTTHNLTRIEQEKQLTYCHEKKLKHGP